MLRTSLADSRGKNRLTLFPPESPFRRHHHDAGRDEAGSDTFDEIPAEIFRGDFDGSQPYPGDNDIRFGLHPEFRVDPAGRSTRCGPNWA